MEDKKPCIRCERLIDPFARICPFCNWEQDVAPPKETPLPAATPAEEVVDPALEEKRQLRQRLLMAAGIAALLLLTFAIGSFIARLGRKPVTPEEETPSSVQTPSRSATQLTDLRLIQVDPTSPIGRSATSVPQPLGVPANAVGSDADATALPSQQYAELVKRSGQQQVAGTGGADTLDPRTIVAPPIPQIRRPAPAPRPAPAEREEPRAGGDNGGRRTLPEPISQPLPDIDATGTARFRLRIGTDGRVMEVDVLQSIPGATPKLIAAIQRWKFRPATEDGRPVEGVHLVDISFKGQND